MSSELDDFLCQTPEEEPEEENQKDPTSAPFYWIEKFKKKKRDAFDEHIDKYHNEPQIPWWLVARQLARAGYPHIASIINSTQFQLLPERNKFICAMEIFPDYGFIKEDWSVPKKSEEISELQTYFKDWGYAETIANLDLVHLLFPGSTIHEIVTTGGLEKISKRRKKICQVINK